MEFVETFGFRGEALSSLCSLCDLKIITNTNKDSPTATELDFDHDGNISSQTICPGKKGTHVIISNLFHTLHVRRKDFVDNAKREFAKAVGFLQAYAIIHTKIKFVVSNTLGSNNKKSMLITTSAKDNMKSNIASVFGVQAVANIMPFDISFNLNTKAIKIQGFISKPIFGQGRSTSDRQFFYINSRPCVLPQITKAFNETYKNFNTLQSPFVVANIILDTKLYDVNVTPDKRTIFIHDESDLIENTKQELTLFLEKTSYTIPQNNITTDKTIHLKTSQQVPKKPQTIVHITDVQTLQVASKSALNNTVIDSNYSRDTVLGNGIDQEASENASAPKASQNTNKKLTDFIIRRIDTENTKQPLSPTENIDINVSSGMRSSTLDIKGFSLQSNNKRSRLDDTTICVPQEKYKTINQPSVPNSKCRDHPELLTPNTTQTENETKSPRTAVRSKTEQSAFSHILRSRTCNFDASISVLTDKLGMARQEMEILEEKGSSNETVNSRASSLAKKLSNIKLSNINEDESRAETTLDLSINKNDFLNMEIVGQFNKGFILVTSFNPKTKKKDLFIVDQHASDEIYNFEQLNQNTVIRNQPLVTPLTLDISAIDEITVISNITVFEKNGFKIEFDDDEPPGKKCKLTSIPISKSTHFGVEDVQELIYLLQTKPGQSDVKCSKIRSMFASRACRKSIMIGDSLTPKIMSTVVKHLSGLDRPWNCPHGRPTMRHLANIGQFTGTFEDCIS